MSIILQRLFDFVWSGYTYECSIIGVFLEGASRDFYCLHTAKCLLAFVTSEIKEGL